MTTLGMLKRIDLRTGWETEDRHFTPWLAQKQNLQILGETIGIELELEAQEQEVGPFRADILCKNTVDDTWVLIENQLEKTDHKHLGQLITYAAGLEAVTIVWISSKFTQEHMAAIQWLNKITDGNFRFFGLEVELWQINDSLPAPKFNIIAQPNDWSSDVTRAAKKIEYNMDERNALQYEYWSSFVNYLKEQSDTKCRTPRARGWFDFPIGKANFFIRLSITTQAQKISAGVYLYRNMKDKFDALYARKTEIEAIFGHPLEWENNPDKETAVIKTEKRADINNKSDWLKQHEWLKEALEKLDTTFRPIAAEF